MTTPATTTPAATTPVAGHPATEPLSFAGLRLTNRFAVAPMTRVSATEDGVPTPEMADYYAEFAKGGFGLVITEGTYTDTTFSQGYARQPGIVAGRHVSAWTAIVDRVKAAGTPIVLQLMHAGALSQGNHYRTETLGPSAVRPRGEKMPEYGGSGPWDVPRAMTPDDIEEAVEGFVASAVNARRAGFQGVEVHAANGYLLDQFLTDYTNERTDRFGGDAHNRVRLTATVLNRIRVALGPDFVVGVRLSQTKVNDFTHRWSGPAEAETIFRAVAEAGASYLHVASEGRDWLETAKLEGGETITALARRVTGLPVIANGGMHKLDQAGRLLTEGHADVLSIGRGALANPDLPYRVTKGEALDRFDHTMVQPMATLENARLWREKRDAV
ncbi:tRNA-dihydrouridine synthase [Embleya sp. NPDC050154]|uniref:oxidoreductase n=1 Tax=unclassified Embleya TaxID=2699296 RepID=UPI0037B8AE82